jgi:predicted glycoside hydrolase/deacetylase ChbG (UPF0249 family)
VVSRGVIVNADDFGQSAGINRGVIEAHEHGIVTSASLMVRDVAASEAATYARARPGFSIGLHVDLSEWSRQQGEWICLYERVDNGDELNRSFAWHCKQTRAVVDAYFGIRRVLPALLDSL